jgi:hypothetical protein
MNKTLNKVLYVDQKLNDFYKFTNRLKGYFDEFVYSENFNGSERFFWTEDKPEFPTGSWFIGIDESFDLELLVYIFLELDTSNCAGIFVLQPNFYDKIVFNSDNDLSKSLFIGHAWATEDEIIYRDISTKLFYETYFTPGWILTELLKDKKLTDFLVPNLVWEKRKN